jgi:plastocyanin
MSTIFTMLRFAVPRTGRAVVFLVAAAASLSPLSALAQSSAPRATSEASASEVRVDNFTFSPPTLTIPAGTTVTWVNADDIPHTIAAKDRSFRSKPLDTDDRFSFTFNSPGEYDYFCSLHPHMVGKIVVRSGNSSS